MSNLPDILWDAHIDTRDDVVAAAEAITMASARWVERARGGTST